MGDNGVVNTGHFDTSRIGNEKMIRAEQTRAKVLNTLVERVVLLEAIVEGLLLRDGGSMQDFKEPEKMVEIEGDTLTGDGTGQELPIIDDQTGEDTPALD